MDTIKYNQNKIKKDPIPWTTQLVDKTKGHPSIFYGLPTIHKSGILLIPIVNPINIPIYKHLVKNSRHLVEILDKSDVLVNFDVSLVTKLPIGITQG